MTVSENEWLKQADYDMETAEYMFSGGRYFYAVFMDQSTVLKIIERFRNALERTGVKNSRIILFGSHAQNTAGQASDIDLVVISSDFVGKSFWERIDILTDAIYEVAAPIEATAMTPEEWEREDSMICSFARQGMLIPA